MLPPITTLLAAAARAMDLRQIDARARRELQAMLKAARAKARAMGESLDSLTRREVQDYDSIRGFDEIAEYCSQEWPQYFHGTEDVEGRLFDLLTAGPSVRLSLEEAFDRACTTEDCESGMVSDEPIPE